MARKSSQQILDALSAANDHKFTRDVGIWSLEKLAIIMLYVSGFANACKRAGGGYYVDGLAGPGMCRVRNAVQPPVLVKGSPIIALETRPRLARCILMENGIREAAILSERARPYGDRAIVHHGDVNADLAKLIQHEVHPKAPCFCLLDPEGVELHWETVEAIAALPGRKRKPELLILFPIENAIRLFPTKKEMTEYTKQQLDRWLGSFNWVEIYRARLDGRISPSQALERYVALYEDGLAGLGYKFVQAKDVIAPDAPTTQRRKKYRLVFATDHSKGAEIMDDVFTRPYVLDFPVTGQMPLEL